MITNLRSMQGVGIFADRNARSHPLQLRQYNLIYGFNGSGKTTLSRLFSSLESGALHPELPGGCSFEVALNNGAAIGCPTNPHGLERNLLVFNTDYIEQNLQWSTGHASPVFYIGADQAEAANKLAKLEEKIAKQAATKREAEAAETTADKTFAGFRRERAKSVASYLHLGSRKYEAPALVKDYETWQAEDGGALTDDQLKAAEDTRRLAEPMPPLDILEFDTSSIGTAHQSITEICSQSLITVALDEIQRFPEMLLWLKEGHEFHERNDLEVCLFCGSPLTSDRRAYLASAFDSQVDQFVARLARDADTLQSVMSTLVRLDEGIPTSDSLAAKLRTGFKETRDTLVTEVRQVRKHMTALQDVLTRKRERPATPADISGIPSSADGAAAADRLAQAIKATNETIATHNAIFRDFTKHKDEAELAIRKHFIADCRADYADHAKKFEDATAKVAEESGKLDELNSMANQLRQQIREHGPAAGVINKLIASYLGHGELTINPVEGGYQLQRHGQPIRGVPSEGEKTAIAISYFLSSIEAEGRKLKDMIVIIDDPVSSLDTKALNYACSLIRNRLSGAKQVFVLTHNLQCMNEFRKAWKNRTKASDGKDPTATFLFIDVTIPEGQNRRTSNIVEMSRLLREYDSEYHYLFSHVLKFISDPNIYDDHGYMMPNVLRRVLDVFLAFKCPGCSGLSGQLGRLCSDFPDLDRGRLAALERLAQVESHSDNLDDLLSFSSMTLEETQAAAAILIDMIEQVDPKHLAGVRHLCR